MNLNDKKTLWELIEKYDSANTEFADALSNILQDKATSKDYEVVFTNYRKIEDTDEMTVDSVLGDKLMFEILE